MNPKTQEYLEAEQLRVDNLKEKILNDLPPEDKKKFEIVEECVKKMTDNKINFHLYALLPNSLYNKDVVWQYNSLTALAEFDSNGKLTEKSSNLIGLCCAGMMTKIFDDITDYKLGKTATFEERYKCFNEFLYHSLVNYYNYLKKNE